MPPLCAEYVGEIGERPDHSLRPQARSLCPGPCDRIVRSGTRAPRGRFAIRSAAHRPGRRIRRVGYDGAGKRLGRAIGQVGARWLRSRRRATRLTTLFQPDQHPAGEDRAEDETPTPAGPRSASAMFCGNSGPRSASISARSAQSCGSSLPIWPRSKRAAPTICPARPTQSVFCGPMAIYLGLDSGEILRRFRPRPPGSTQSPTSRSRCRWASAAYLAGRRCWSRLVLAICGYGELVLSGERDEHSRPEPRCHRSCAGGRCQSRRPTRRGSVPLRPTGATSRPHRRRRNRRPAARRRAAPDPLPPTPAGARPAAQQPAPGHRRRRRPPPLRRGQQPVPQSARAAGDRPPPTAAAAATEPARGATACGVPTGADRSCALPLIAGSRSRDADQHGVLFTRRPEGRAELSRCPISPACRCEPAMPAASMSRSTASRRRRWVRSALVRNMALDPQSLAATITGQN